MAAQKHFEAAIAEESQLRTAGKKALLAILEATPEGGTVTYESILSVGLNSDLPADRSAIEQCLRKVARESGVIYHNVRGQGYKRTLPSEVNGVVGDRAKRTSRMLSRTKRLCNLALAARYYDRLTPDEKKELYRKAAALGAVSLSAVLSQPNAPALPAGSTRANDRRIELPHVAP